jgi:hypothetical protein
MKDYQKYKWFFTSSKKLVVGGKSASQNDELIKSLKQQRDERIIMHTSAPGSPFTCIVASPGDITKKDISECAAFTAAFSQAWKARKTKAVVDVFRLSQMRKRAGMKTGTWVVNGYVEKLAVELMLVLTKQKGVLRAVPEHTVKKGIIKLVPGSIDKKDLAPKLELETGKVFKNEEILAALPAGGVKLVK